MLNTQGFSIIPEISKSYLVERLLEIENISPITEADEELYECFFKLECERNLNENLYIYGNSWAYILQATRYYPFKYHDKCSLISFTVRNGDRTTFEIIRPLGENVVDQCDWLTKRLSSSFNSNVFLRKLTPNQRKALIKRGFKEIKEWDTNKLCELPDDVWPQSVCDLKDIVLLKGKRFAKLRLAINRFKKYKCRIACFRPELKTDAEEAIRRWKEDFVKRYKKTGLELPCENNYYLDPYLVFTTKFAHKVDSKNYISLIIYVEEQPVGFSFLGKTSETCVALYANICDTQYHGLSEFCAWQSFINAYEAGFSFVNLGGSETLSLFKFYQKFAPIDYVRDYNMVFGKGS